MTREFGTPINVFDHVMHVPLKAKSSTINEKNILFNEFSSD